MTKSIRTAVLAATVFSATGLMAAALTASPARAAGKNCVIAGGTATILPSNGVATFMAEAALKNSIAAQGRTQVGPTKTVCDPSAVVPTCTAKAKACK
jgi:hypothetical protein